MARSVGTGKGDVQGDLLLRGQAEHHLSQDHSAAVHTGLQRTQRLELQGHLLPRGRLIAPITTRAQMGGAQVSQHALELLRFCLPLQRKEKDQPEAGVLAESSLSLSPPDCPVPPTPIISVSD